MARLNSTLAPTRKKDASVMPALKTLTFAALALSVAALAGCGTHTEDDMKTASIENDYRVRHPLSLAEAEHGIDIPVASGDRKLSIDLEDNIRGFAQDYARTTSGTVQVAVPSGSVNSGAARNVIGQIRKVLVASGIKSDHIIVTSYQAPSPNISAPVHLSFVAITAVTSQCGQWPDDLMATSFVNKNWYNFGCASQNNLAAQVANPKDLFDPRAQTPIDAERRSNAITTYRTSGASLGADTSISIPTQ